MSILGPDASNYTLQSVTPATATITPANATINVTGYDVTYNGLAHSATGTATGINGALPSSDLVLNTTHTTAGTYNTDSWTFSAPNYASQSGTVTDTISKVNLKVVAMDASQVYGGSPSPEFLQWTIVGLVNGESIGNGVSGNAGFTGSAVGAINAGSYTITPTIGTLTATNYNFTTFVNGTLTITPATATVNVTPYNVTYNGAAHTATGTATGVNNASLTGLVLSGTTHTNAGVYNDTWTFSNPNYVAKTGTVTDTIQRANASIDVVGYNTFYNATPHIATGVVYGVNGTVLPGLNLGGTIHTNVGAYTDTWTFTDTTGNYNNANGTVLDTITPSKSKMVRETVNVPKATVVKATVLVPGIKEVKVVERVQVNGNWIKKTVLVPETVMVKKTVLVNVTKMVKRTEMVKVYYS